MKRLTQLATVAVIALLVVTPALASLPCTSGLRAACAGDCPMMMNGMGTDCPMAGRETAGGCSPNCCAAAASQVAVFAVTPKKLKLASGVSTPVVIGEAVAQEQSAAIDSQTETRATSPPHYLLNRVFRI
jgi:hypothetical protein